MDITPVPIPAVVSGADVNMTQDDVLLDDEFDYPFQSDIGSMWWLANISRPDIFFAVHRCAVWQNRPSRKLWRWLQQIKRYLAGTTHLGIVYQRSSASTPQLSGFVDGAFASEDEVGWFFLFMAILCCGLPKIPSVFSLPQLKWNAVASQTSLLNYTDLPVIGQNRAPAHNQQQDGCQ